MKSYIYLCILITTASTIIYPTTFDYAMASTVDTLFKREPAILNSQEAFHKLTQVALSFWNSNTPALLNFIKNEQNSIPTTLQALSCIRESIDLGQALFKAGILKEFESQYLLAALVLDKITAIRSKLYEKNDLITFNPETIIILKARLTNLLDSLKLIIPRLQYSYLEVATHIALQISQPQLTHNKIIYPALGAAQIIDLHIKDKTAKESLKSYKLVIDVRDDSNSGYRAFLASIFMHAIDSYQKEPINHIEYLVTNRFFDLFMKYDELFPTNIKNEIGHSIRKNLVAQLHAINRCKNVEQVRQLLNSEILFDFYMIKFLKYLIIDHGTDFGDSQTMILTIHKNIEKYQNHVIAWGNEMTDLELMILAKATNITISILQQDSHHQALTIHKALPKSGTSYILSTKNSTHYQILLPKRYQFNKNIKS